MKKIRSFTSIWKLCYIILIPGMLIFFKIKYSNAQSSPRIRILIVDGFSNHDWQQTTSVTKWILEESQLFEVDVTTFPSDSISRLEWMPKFNDYAVIIQNTNNIHNTNLKWPRNVEQELEKYVMNGGGLYILHSANNAFPHWKAYDEMIGLGWRSKTNSKAFEIDPKEKIITHLPGQGQDTGHDERFNAVIQILKRHPINEGYPEAWQTVNTEVYYYPRGKAINTEILSYAYDSTGTQKNWPVEWVVKFGKGRVYNSTLGHLWEGEVYPEAYRCVGYQTTLIRATEWLALGKVSYPLPKNFPDKSTPSLKSPDAFLNRPVVLQR